MYGGSILGYKIMFLFLVLRCNNVADIFTKEKRSWVMSRIRSKDTKIDLRMNDLLFSMGCKYEKYPKMYGSPDFLVEKRIAVFCDGGFWHGYKYDKKKNSLNSFWQNKIEKNMIRDKTVSRKLRKEGFSVLRLWEHDIEKRIPFCKNKIMRKILEKKLSLAHKRKKVRNRS